ncbi:MAG: N-acetylglucosamine-6-phosphate deacetylase [Bacteroidetes bacterium]|nr:N-acetylglucosamine-6-phosphate deacetylase [Bacteroidota bacterium]
MDTLILTNGTVYADTGTIENGYVVISGERITTIAEGTPPADPEGKIIDVQGKVISPGFIDMHTHGILDVDFMESSFEDTEKALYAYTQYGVTRVVATMLSNPISSIIAQGKLLRKVKQESPIGCLMHGVHVEGPWLAPRCRGGHAAEYLCIPQKEDVEAIIDQIGDVVKTLTYAPELENTLWLTEQLEKNGIIPVFGHTEATYEQAEQAIKAGARHVTHMYDTTLGYKENPDEALVMMPGMETAVLYYDQVSIELIGCPVHVPKPFFKFLAKVKPHNRTIIVTDSLVGTGRPDGTIITYKDGRKAYVEKGVLRMIDSDPAVHGNLTGSAVTMNVALSRLAEYAELSQHDAIKWGSINPATTLGIDDETGSLKVGKYADIAIIDKDFGVVRTLLRGKTVFEKDADYE